MLSICSHSFLEEDRMSTQQEHTISGVIKLGPVTSQIINNNTDWVFSLVICGTVNWSEMKELRRCFLRVAFT